MFSEETEKLVTDAVVAEAQNARKHGEKYNSNHEGYGVLLEEVDEVNDALRYLEEHKKALWQMVKSDCDSGIRIELTHILSCAIDVAKEAIQVAAVAYKFKGADK